MDFGIVNKNVYKSFSVIDSEGNPVTGLNDNDLVIKLFDDNGNEINGSIQISVIELEDGHYRIGFIPVVSGEYFIVIYNNDYFPNGKTGTIRIYEESFDSLGDRQKLILGLVHENIFIDQTVFDSNNNMIKARIRIYSNSDSVGTENDILSSYQITAVSDGPGKFKSWMQIKE